MQKLDLVIIGAQKAGTTSLKNYLGEHPNIQTHTPIEFSYFRDDNEYSLGIEKAINISFGPTDPLKKLIAKNAGMFDDPESIKRLYQYNADCKLVLLFREPVSRLISAYKMEKFNGWLDYTIDDFVEVANDKETDHLIYRKFLKFGLYYDALLEITKYFPKEQIKLIHYSELKKDTKKVCEEIFNWLNVDDNFVPNVDQIHNVSKAAKSATLGSIIHFLRSEKNIFKKMAKTVLPARMFTKIGNRIIESNKSTQPLEIHITDDQYQILKKYYQESNKLLQSEFNFDTSGW